MSFKMVLQKDEIKYGILDIDFINATNYKCLWINIIKY